jgi:outer membrane lipoprotein-sorting protein
MKRALLIFTILSFVTIIFSETKTKILDKIQENLSSISTFSATFNESIVPVIGKTQSFVGIIDIARPCSLRMEVTSPEKQLILYNGEIAWIYFPEKKYCLKYKVGEENSLTKIPGYIFDPFNSLILDTLYEDTASIYIRLSTGAGEEFFESIELRVSLDELLPYSLTLKDKIGNKTEYTFSKIKKNVKKQVNFTFNPPKGTEIIER